MVFRSFTGAIAWLVFTAPVAARPTLDAAHLDQLDHYQVLTFNDPFEKGIERGKAIGVIDATPEEVFRVATDYAKYKDFMPSVVASRVRESWRDHALVELTAALHWPAGMSSVVAFYSQEKLPGDIYRVHFERVRGTLRQYFGTLYIEPFAAGKTAVTYELVAEPSARAPRSAVNRGILRSVENFVHALRQRINGLIQAGYLHPEPITPSRIEVRAPLVPPTKPTTTLKAETITPPDR
jgi:ribosome-associated toxin RatA of RatAB toxin-antitoxin module